MRYRIVPTWSRWAVEAEVKEGVWELAFDRQRPPPHDAKFDSEDLAERFIDALLADERRGSVHMATPPRIYPPEPNPSST